ncbi:unnamed protein product, partial [Amoebophrya sp. A120]|eukprot:GSA120T00024650001.1
MASPRLVLPTTGMRLFWRSCATVTGLLSGDSSSIMRQVAARAMAPLLSSSRSGSKKMLLKSGQEDASTPASMSTTTNMRGAAQAQPTAEQAEVPSSAAQIVKMTTGSSATSISNEAAGEHDQEDPAQSGYNYPVGTAVGSSGLSFRDQDVDSIDLVEFSAFTQISNLQKPKALLAKSNRKTSADLENKSTTSPQQVSLLQKKQKMDLLKLHQKQEQEMFLEAQEGTKTTESQQQQVQQIVPLIVDPNSQQAAAIAANQMFVTPAPSCCSDPIDANPNDQFVPKIPPAYPTEMIPPAE